MCREAIAAKGEDKMDRFIGSQLRAALLVSAAAVSAAGATPTFAQASGEPADLGDIVVTARRSEERLQDVPISITVYNQEQLANRNVTNAVDLANYTPSLSANSNFGIENTSFAIRGFVQELGTQ